MNRKSSIVIVDDHPIFRRGLKEIIESDSQFAVVAEAGDGETALREVKALKPEVVVLDLHLPKIGGT